MKRLTDAGVSPDHPAMKAMRMRLQDESPGAMERMDRAYEGSDDAAAIRAAKRRATVNPFLPGTLSLLGWR